LLQTLEAWVWLCLQQVCASMHAPGVKHIEISCTKCPVNSTAARKTQCVHYANSDDAKVVP